MATIGLTPEQLKALSTMPGIDQKLVSAYKPTVTSSTQATTTPKAPVTSGPTAPLTTQNSYTPYTPQTSQADQYYKQLMASMVPTKEENALAGQQSSLDAQLRNLSTGQGVMNRKIADQPIELDFITGQQKAVDERYGLQRQDVQNQQQTLAQRLANLQRTRQSAIDVARIGVDYGQGQDSRADTLTQRNFDNQYNVNGAVAKTTPTSTVPKSTTPTPPTTSTPVGGYDSSGGTNYLTLKTADLKASAQKMFSPAFSTKLISSLTDEQLRLFLNDFTQTQNTAQMSINPEDYFAQWKAAAGIGGSSSTSTRSI